MEGYRKRVLVTGATGFIGRRLVAALVGEGIAVKCLTRKADAALPDGVETVVGDMLDQRSLHQALLGVDTAYYLVHAMGGDRSGFERRDREAAVNFVTVAEKHGLRRAIYLGGLGEEGDSLSAHLASRREVGKILQSGEFLTTWLRAAVIIGAGSASFEMIRRLVDILPLMITPRWVSTRCQPIAVHDVIAYLVGCLKDERTAGRTFDIGGPEILSYREMMERYADLRKTQLFMLPLPLLTPKLSSYWVALLTPVKSSVSIPLIEGLANEAICHDQEIRTIIPLRLTPYDEALRVALSEEGAAGSGGS